MNAEIIRKFIAAHNLEDKVRVEGCLCEGKCKQGPNVTINGKTFSQISSDGLDELLGRELGV
jgi:NADH:ubiquinone oxidoreductase subunit E